MNVSDSCSPETEAVMELSQGGCGMCPPRAVCGLESLRAHPGVV